MEDKILKWEISLQSYKGDTSELQKTFPEIWIILDKTCVSNLSCVIDETMAFNDRVNNLFPNSYLSKYSLWVKIYQESVDSLIKMIKSGKTNLTTKEIYVVCDSPMKIGYDVKCITPPALTLLEQFVDFNKIITTSIKILESNTSFINKSIDTQFQTETEIETKAETNLEQEQIEAHKTCGPRKPKVKAQIQFDTQNFIKNCEQNGEWNQEQQLPVGEKIDQLNFMNLTSDVNTNSLYPDSLHIEGKMDSNRPKYPKYTRLTKSPVYKKGAIKSWFPIRYSLPHSLLYKLPSTIHPRWSNVIFGSALYNYYVYDPYTKLWKLDPYTIDMIKREKSNSKVQTEDSIYNEEQQRFLSEKMGVTQNMQSQNSSLEQDFSIESTDPIAVNMAHTLHPEIVDQLKIGSFLHDSLLADEDLVDGQLPMDTLKIANKQGRVYQKKIESNLEESYEGEKCIVC